LIDTILEVETAEQHFYSTWNNWEHAWSYQQTAVTWLAFLCKEPGSAANQGLHWVVMVLTHDHGYAV